MKFLEHLELSVRNALKIVCVGGGGGDAGGSANTSPSSAPRLEVYKAKKILTKHF